MLLSEAKEILNRNGYELVEITNTSDILLESLNLCMPKETIKLILKKAAKLIGINIEDVYWFIDDNKPLTKELNNLYRIRAGIDEFAHLIDKNYEENIGYSF